jgi:hypothetical protein
VRWESWERIVVFLIGLLIPFGAVWYFVGDAAAAGVRALASLGGSAVGAIVIFLWSMLRLPSVMEAEAEQRRLALESQLETEAKRQQKIEALGQFMAEAEKLQTRILASEVSLIDDVNEWAGRASNFIEASLGTAYAQRFGNDAGTSSNFIVGANITAEQQKVWGWVNRRIERLDQFMGERA